MSRDDALPQVKIAGREAAVDRICIQERPLDQVRANVELPARELSAAPHSGDELEIEAGGETLRGRVTAAHLVRRPESTRVRLVARTDLAVARAPWTVHVRGQNRSTLLRHALQGVELVVERAAASDEAHALFTALGESRWREAGRLALLGGQLLLATTRGYVLARPDAPERGLEREVERWWARNCAIPELVLVAMDGTAPGKAVRRKRTGTAAGGAHLVLVPHTATAGELQAAAEAVAATIGGGRFRMTGGPDLFDLEPGSWVKVGAAGDRLVTGRVRTWNPELGWEVALSGGYPWERVLHRADSPACEPAEVVGIDEEHGLLRVRLLRLDLEVLAGIRADRAGRERFAVTLPNLGDLGFVTFTAAELATYMGAPLPGKLVGKKEFDEWITALRDANARSELTRGGKQQECFKEVQRECEGRVINTAQQFEFKRRS